MVVLHVYNINIYIDVQPRTCVRGNLTLDNFSKFCCGSRRLPLFTSSLLLYFLSYIMKNPTPHHSIQLKHRVCSYYKEHLPDCSFRSVSRLFGLHASGRVLSRWYHQWDGTANSLKEKVGRGRHSILNRAEINRHITFTIRRHNRISRPVSYRHIHCETKAKTCKEMSLRTIQRYGKEKYAIKYKTTKKRTLHERKNLIHI